jgi:uncharacterized membrane-anchored protein YhcB (DUF1043 family)
MNSNPLREEGMVETSDATNSAAVIQKMQVEIKEHKKEINEHKKETKEHKKETKELVKEHKKKIDSLKESMALLMKLSTHKNPHGEVKEDHPSSDTAVSSIKDAKTMHKNLHWNKLKIAVEAAHSFKSSSSSSRKKNHSKRLSTVIYKSSAQFQHWERKQQATTESTTSGSTTATLAAPTDIEILIDLATNRRSSVDKKLLEK